MEYAKNTSINIITSIINESVNSTASKNKINTIQVEKNKNGDIVDISFNNNRINEFLYLTTNQLLESIDKLENSNYENIYLSNNKKLIFFVPINVIHDIPIISNICPKIPFKIEIIGNIDDKASNVIKEYGINSSLIEVVLSYTIQIQVIMPFQSKTFTITKDIILDSKIIQGKVPDYYGGFISSSLK